MEDQREEILDIIDFARKNSTFYAVLYKDCPVRISSLSDVPVLDKEHYWRAVRFDLPSLLTTEDVATVVVSSGGTTGLPKTVVYSRDDWSYKDEVIVESWVQSGLAAGDRVANLGYAGELYASFLNFHELLQKTSVPIWNYPIMGATELDTVLRLITGFKINVIFGTPTKIMQLFSLYLKTRDEMQIEASQPFPINKVFFTGEPFLEDQAEILRQVSPDIKIISSGHASVDAGLIGLVAPDCGADEHRVCSELTHVEILDLETGVEAQVGVPGRMVATSKCRSLMPVIRYPVGDLAKWLEPPGVPHRKYLLMGRLPEAFSLANGKYTYNEFKGAIDRFEEVSAFQIELSRFDRRDRLLLRVVVRSAVDDSFDGRLLRRLNDDIPALRYSLKDNWIHPIEIRVVDFSDLKVNERTGKLVEVVDSRPTTESRRSLPVATEQEATIVRILARAAEVEASTIAMDSDLFDDLGVDSVSLIQAVVWIEQELAVSLDEREVLQVKSTRDLVDLVACGKARPGAGSIRRTSS